MINKKLVCCAVLTTILQISAVSAYASVPQNINPNLVPQGGMTNTYDMKMLQDLKRREVENQDFKNYQERKKEESKEHEQDSEQQKIKEKKEIIKATVEEYATKGVYVDNIQISPSQILTETELHSIINEHLKTNITFEQLDNIVKAINKLYLEKGFVTARAYIPEQTIENNIIKIELIEGKVGNIRILGNRWTKTGYIESGVYLQKGEIFDLNRLEEKLVKFNRYNNGVNLSGTLVAGKSELGTTDIEINVKEKLPFHSTLLVDNAGRNTIGKTRTGLILQHDSLLGKRDKLTVGTYVSSHSVTPFVDYNIPVNEKGGRIGANFSYGYSDIAKGPYKIFDINSRSYNYSLYYNQPIIRKTYMELSSNSALSYKQGTTSFSDVNLYTDKVASAQTGVGFRYDSQRGIWYAHQNIGYAFPIFDKDSNYLKLDGGVVRLHDFGHGIVAQVRGQYQAIPKDVVPYLDQFQIGGGTTVRGYNEALVIGRSGYLISSELTFPVAPSTIKIKNTTKPFIGNYVKGLAFVDHGAVFPYKGNSSSSSGNDSSDFLLGIGAGLRINLPGDVNARLAWGIPCIANKYESDKHWGRFHFEVSMSPDYDMLLKSRKPKQPENL